MQSINHKNESLIFTNEDITDNKHLSQHTLEETINIMVVDDEKEVHDVTHMVLSDFTFEGKALNIIDAYSAKEAKKLLTTNSQISLLLLDVVMESDDSGLELIKYIRENLGNKMVRIILRTGQAGQAPEHEVITKYDINDYKSKTELTVQKLYTTIISSLRSFRDLKALEETNLLNEQMMNSLPCIAMLLDQDGKVKLCNRPALDKGITIGDSYIFDENNANKFPLQELPLNFNCNKKIKWEKCIDNTWFEIFWAPLKNKQFLLYVFDISERKHEEEESKRYQKLFQQSQKMESIGVIASGIAHDFNNILTVINGYAEMMTFLFPEGGEEYEAAKAILNAGTSGSKLAKRLLSLSRKQNEELSEVDVHKIIDDVIRLIAPTCSDIVIKSNLKADSSIILGEETLLKNALINLGVNAKDAMTDGGTTTYKTSCIQIYDKDLKFYPEKLTAGKYIKIEVEDTGTGIDKKTLDRIFEPLFTTKEKGKGTGLGLAGVYNCAQTHKGFVTVETEIGKGTVFSLVLPLINNTPGE